MQTFHTIDENFSRVKPLRNFEYGMSMTLIFEMCMSTSKFLHTYRCPWKRAKRRKNWCTNSSRSAKRSNGCSKFKSGCRCSVFQPVAVCSHILLPYVAVCLYTAAQNSAAAVVALYCSLLRNVAVCCSCSEFKSFCRKTTKGPFQ